MNLLRYPALGVADVGGCQSSSNLVFNTACARSVALCMCRHGQTLHGLLPTTVKLRVSNFGVPASLVLVPFVRILLAQPQATREALLIFLRDPNLSSHVRVIVRRP